MSGDAEEGKRAVNALVGGTNPERTLEGIRRRHEEGRPFLPGPSSTYDRLGRKQFTRSSFWTMLRWIPGLLERAVVIPASAVEEQGSDELGDYCLVKCPCGARPVARPCIDKCPGCERYYVVSPDGGRVIVAYGDMEVPKPPASG